MSRMVANSKDLLDQDGDPAACPYLPDEAVVFGSLGQQFWQPGQLIHSQAGCRPGGGTVPKSFDAASFPCPPEPLAHGSPSDAQRPGYVDLFPALLFQLEGSYTAAFLPGQRFGCGAHVS